MHWLTRLADVEENEPAFALQHCAPGSDGGANCITLHADGTRNTTRFAALPPHVQTRALAKKTRSRRCKSCDSHGETKFASRDGHNRPLNTPDKKQPLSAGRPVKLSTARLLAAHLRRVVCAGNKTCPELYDALGIPSANWTRSKFLVAALRTPNIMTAAPAPNDTALWARPWAWCVKDGECSGSVDRADWINPRTRGETCRDVIKSEAAESTLPVHFCTVDVQSAEICRKVVMWQGTIATILCRALGFAGCQETPHVYSPTTYSVSNREFVHDTVLAFYENNGDDGKCATNLNDQELLQKQSNDDLKQRCASTSLVPLRTALRKMREIKTLVIELFFYVSSAGSQVLCVRLCLPVCSVVCSPYSHVRAQIGMLVAGMLVSASDGGAMIDIAANKLLKYIGLAIDLLLEIIDELSRVLFQVIFGQGFPKTMLDTLEMICGWTNFILVEIVSTSPTSGVLCKIFNWLSGAFEDLASMIMEIMVWKIPVTGGQPFNSMLAPAHKGFMTMAFLLKNALPCSPDQLIACDFTIEEEDSVAEVCAVCICIVVGV